MGVPGGAVAARPIQVALPAVAVTAACALLAVAAAIGRTGGPSTLPLALGLAVLGAAALLRPVEPAPGTKFTLAGALGVFAGCALPGAQAVLAISGAALAAKLIQRASPSNLAVNVSKAAGATGAASLVVDAAGTGVPGLGLAGLAYIAVTLAAVGAMVLASQGPRSAAAFVGRELLPSAALVATGLIGVLLWIAEPIAIALLVLPLAAIELAARATARAGRMARELSAALEAQRAFAADAAHELRTPLTALRGNLAYIDESRLGEDDRQAFTDARRDLGRLLALIERLLVLARVETRDERAYADLAACARDAARSLAPRGSVRLSFVLPETAGVAMPPELLRTVVTDVVANALAYTPDTPDGEVSLTVRADGDRAVLTVRDTGIGMEREEAVRAFDRFYRGARARRLAPGSGLGLAIVRRIVDAYGGRVELASEPGAGTTVTVTLPAQRRQEPGGTEVPLRVT